MQKSLKYGLFLLIGTSIINNIQVFSQQAGEIANPEEYLSGILTIEENSLIASSPLPEPKVVKVMKVMATAYSSTPHETDDTPFITASGSGVRNGIIANNMLAFGTKIRLPELYGEKIFVVKDRMARKHADKVDIWFASKELAKQFGKRKLQIQVLEETI